MVDAHTCLGVFEAAKLICSWDSMNLSAGPPALSLSKSVVNETESGRAFYNCTAGVSVTGRSTGQSNPWRLLC